MSWQNAADLATVVGIVIALLGVIVSGILTWRGQSQERKLAQASAERAESAAALTEEYTRRVVHALETLADHGLTGAGAPRPRDEVQWSLTHWNGDAYKLENMGTLTAADVTVTAHESLRMPNVIVQDIPPHEALTFMAVRTMATSDSTITVTWRDDTSDASQVWKYPLPPRPKR